MLEAAGVVTVKRGSKGGTFVNPVPTNMIADAVLLMARLNMVVPEELAEVRGLLEGYGAWFAAEHKTPELIANLRSAMAVLNQLSAETDWPDFARAELECHAILFRATDNGLLLSLQQALYEAALAQFRDIPFEWRDRVISDWQDLLASIATGDGNPARELMTDHIRHFANVVSDVRTRPTPSSAPRRTASTRTSPSTNPL
jgi:GntR family transcriptional repressor for pyruvate dehydrogenase complex